MSPATFAACAGSGSSTSTWICTSPRALRVRATVDTGSLLGRCARARAISETEGRCGAGTGLGVGTDIPLYDEARGLGYGVVVHRVHAFYDDAVPLAGRARAPLEPRAPPALSGREIDPGLGLSVVGVRL